MQGIDGLFDSLKTSNCHLEKVFSYSGFVKQLKNMIEVRTLMKKICRSYERFFLSMPLQITIN